MAVLEIERRGAAAWLWLNRPEVRNALNAEMQDALGEALDALEKDKAVRVLVVGGRGPAFSAGGDLGKMEAAAKLEKTRSRKEAMRFANLLLRVHAYPKPLIARVHGPAFAGGMGLAAACDLVIASEQAEFCLPEVRIGLVPAMISPYIVRAMGPVQARRYVLTGERLKAPKARRIGFVHECVPEADLDKAVGYFAEQLSRAGPQALAEAKKLLATVEQAGITPKVAADTAAVLVRVRAGAEAREGIRAFLEKRKPSWS